jgi:exopolysaccharide biosynthesis polyprenyl glycosylphosphotransferase
MSNLSELPSYPGNDIVRRSIPYLLRKLLLDTLQFLDLVAVVLCFLLTAAVVSSAIPNLSFEQFLMMRVQVSNFLLMGAFMAAWHLILVAFGLYESRRLSSLKGEAIDILKATSLGTGLLLVLSVIMPIRMVDTLFLVVYWASISVFMILGRLVLRSTLRRVRLMGRNLRHVVIVGVNDRALRLAKKIETMPELGYRIKGFVDEPPASIDGLKGTEYPLLASLSDFRSFLNQNPVDEVMICLPMKSRYEEAWRIVSLCEQEGIIVRLLSDLFNPKLGRLRVESLGGQALITIITGALAGWPLIAKRLLDIVGSGLLLVLFSPVLLATVLLIKVTSPGPVFFVQERLGQNKRLFRIYKFRTMVQGADQMQKELEHLNEVDGPAFKIRDDPRITPVGKFLRKTSIDELPQLFNVLKGDISLVGPRPLPVRDYRNFHEDWHRRRFSVKPGITCLWQVGGRSDLDFDQWMKLDMFYIDHWSFWLDLKILLRTVPAVLQGRGAT